MLSFLYRMSDFYLFILVSLVFIIVSIFAILIVRQRIPRNLRYRYNPVVGNIAALIGVIYGVLAGLMALYLINNINYTADAVQREASAVANLYRDSQWLKGPNKSNIQSEIKNYLQNVINVEWPLMREGKLVTSDGSFIIEKIATQVSQYPIVNNADIVIASDILSEIKSLYNAREQRIHMSYSTLNIEIWIVILIGTILTIGINYLFRISFYLHVLTVSAAALMCASMIFLLLTLDKPFQGEFAIQPDSFISLLTIIENRDHTTVAPL